MLFRSKKKDQMTPDVRKAGMRIVKKKLPTVDVQGNTINLQNRFAGLENQEVEECPTVTSEVAEPKKVTGERSPRNDKCSEMRDSKKQRLNASAKDQQTSVPVLLVEKSPEGHKAKRVIVMNPTDFEIDLTERGIAMVADTIISAVQKRSKETHGSKVGPGEEDSSARKQDVVEVQMSRGDVDVDASSSGMTEDREGVSTEIGRAHV